MEDGLDILDELTERALRTAAEEFLEPEFDLLAAAGAEADEGAIPDLDLGGYIAQHDRPPAFTGSDGQPYTIGFDTDETGDPDRPFAAFLVFIRWAATGAGIMDHLESGDLAFGSSPDEAITELLGLSLYEIKVELDAAIARRRAEEED